MGARVFLPPPPETPQEYRDRLPDLPRIRFESKATVVGRIQPSTLEEIAEEPVIVGCTIEHAAAYGGPLMQRYLAALPDDWKRPDEDVRVGVVRDELSPGWNPCAAPWHIDGTSRATNLRSDGQPDMRDPGRMVEQINVCCGPASPTGFLIGAVDLPEMPLGVAPGDPEAQLWYMLFNETLERQIDAGTIDRWLAPPDALVHYGFGDFHTGSVSQAPGWRCFIKAMRYRGDPLPDTVRYRERGSVTWPRDADQMPNDPCGVFPDDVP